MSAICVCLPYPVAIVQLYITDSGLGSRTNNAGIKPGNTQGLHFWVHQVQPHLENTPYVQQVNSAGIKLNDAQENTLTHYWSEQISHPWNARYTQQVDSIMENIQRGHLVVGKERSDRIIHALVDNARKTIKQKIADGAMNSRVIDDINRVIMDARGLLYEKDSPFKSSVDVRV